MIFSWEFSKLVELIIFRNIFICAEKLNFIKNYMKARRETRRGGQSSLHFVLRNRTLTGQTFVWMKTSWRRLEDVFCFRLRRRLEDAFRTSWLRPIYSSWPYVFKTSSRPDLSRLRKENAWNRLDAEGDHYAVGVIKCSWGFGGHCKPPNGFRVELWCGRRGRSPRKLRDFHVSQAPTLA